MKRRVRLLESFAAACGTNIVQPVASQRAWPGRVNVQLPSVLTPVDVYISQISTHARRAHEYRFQNPASADSIVPAAGVRQLLIGYTVWKGIPLCVGADASRRFNSNARFSVLFNVHILNVAAEKGWAEYVSGSGERIVAFHPVLLPSYLQIEELTVDVNEGAVRNAIENAGFAPAAPMEAVERARQAVSRLVRDARFTEDVANAYEGRCAMSGINWQVVQAAHIYPVSAPGSTDLVTNGLALAPTCHALFDKHKIYIDPQDLSVRLHPSVRDDHSQAAMHFRGGILERLRTPPDSANALDIRMLSKRYEWFGDAYSWAS